MGQLNKSGKIFFAVVCISILFLLNGLLSAQGNKSSDDVIILHVIETKPFGYVDSDGTKKGIHYEMIGELQKRTGLKIERQLLPYARVWKGLEDGTHDGGLGWRSGERDSYVTYVNYVFTDYITAFTLKGHKPLKTYNDLYGIGTVGTMRGNSISDKFNNDAKIKKYEVNSYEKALEMLEQGRIDVAVGNVYAMLYLASQSKLKDNIDLPGIKLGFREQWLQMSKKSKVLKYTPQLKKGIESMLKDGYIERINLKYYGDNFKKIQFK